MLIKIFSVQLAAICIVILSSCQTINPKKWTSDDIIISDQANLKFPDRISSQQAREDIDFLIFALTKGYGGRKYIPDDLFSKSISSLNSVSTNSSLAEFHDQIDQALFIIPDNHLMAYYLGRVGKKREAAIEADRGTVGKNNFDDPKKVWMTRVDRVGSKRILYISITGFPNSRSNVWNGFLTSISSKLKKVDALVLDLRGNTGGDDRKGMELAQLLFGHPFEHPITRQFRSQTPETFALAINRLKVESINRKNLGEEIPESNLEELRGLQKDYSLALSGKLPPEFIRTDKGTGSRETPVTGFNRSIYVIMDRGCGSSCEFTIAALEWHPKVKRVGENTSGTFHFSNAGIAILPNSKIKVVIPTQHSEYFDQRFIERIGFTPDVRVSAGSDAYDVTKKIIASH